MGILNKVGKWLVQPTAGGNGAIRIEVESEADYDAGLQDVVGIEEPEVEDVESSEEEADASTGEEVLEPPKPQKAEKAPKPKSKKGKNASNPNGSKNASKPESGEDTKQAATKAKNGEKKTQAKGKPSGKPKTPQTSSMPELIEKSDLKPRPMPWLPKDEEPAGTAENTMLSRVFMCEDGKTCYDIANYLKLCAQPTEIPEVWQWAAEVDAQGRIVSAKIPLQTPNREKKEIRRVIKDAQAEDARNGISLPGRARFLDIRTGDSSLSVSMMPDLQHQLKKGEKERTLDSDVRLAYGQLEKFQSEYAELLRKKDEFLKEREKARKGKGLMDFEIFKMNILALRAELYDLWKKAEVLYESASIYEAGKENASDLEKSSLTKEEQARFLEMIGFAKSLAVIEEEKLDEDFFPEGIFASAPQDPDPENEEARGAVEESDEESDDSLGAVSAEQFDEEGFEAFGKDSSGIEETPESAAEEPETEEELDSGSSYKLTQEELDALLGVDDIPGLIDMSPEEREDLFRLGKTDNRDSEPEDTDVAGETSIETDDGALEPVQEDTLPASKTGEVIGTILSGPTPKSKPEPEPAPQPASTPAPAVQMPNFDMQEFCKNLTVSLTDAVAAAMASVTQQNMAATKQSLDGIEQYAKVNAEQTQKILDLYKGQAQQLGEILTANEEMFDRKLDEHAEKQAVVQKGQIEEALQGATITLEGGLSDEACKQVADAVRREAVSEAQLERCVKSLGNQMKGLAKEQASKEDIQSLMRQTQEIQETMISLGRYMDGVLPQSEQVSLYDAAVGALAEKIGAERVQQLNELPEEQVQELVDWVLQNAEELEV